MKLAQIKSTDVSKSLDKLKDKGFQDSAIRHYFIVINEISEYACDDNIINRNPLKTKSFKKPIAKRKEIKFLDEDSIQKNILFTMILYSVYY